MAFGKQVVKDSDRIAVLKANGYDGATKQILSIARNPDKYALCLVKRAEKILNLAFPNDPIIPAEAQETKERRASEPTLRCHLPEKLKTEILQALEEDGYTDAQSGLLYIFNMYLVRRRHEGDIQQAG